MRRRTPPPASGTPVWEGSGSLPGNQDLVSLRGMHTHKLIMYAVASVFGARVQDLVAPARVSRSVAFYRQVAMYLSHVACGFTMKEVGRLFGRDRTTVSHGCNVVEDRRDDPRFDRSLAILENILRLHAQPGR
jgi:chromosomal replication initiation ATPase DnaA